jgi:hypothetical protein
MDYNYSKNNISNLPLLVFLQELSEISHTLSGFLLGFMSVTVTVSDMNVTDWYNM